MSSTRRNFLKLVGIGSAAITVPIELFGKEVVQEPIKKIAQEPADKGVSTPCLLAESALGLLFKYSKTLKHIKCVPIDESDYRTLEHYSNGLYLTDEEMTNSLGTIIDLRVKPSINRLANTIDNKIYQRMGSLNDTIEFANKPLGGFPYSSNHISTLNGLSIRCSMIYDHIACETQILFDLQGSPRIRYDSR